MLAFHDIFHYTQVHFRHTARLINRLIEHRKPYDLVLFPCERHGPQKLQDKVYLEDRILEHFETHLGVGPSKQSLVVNSTDVEGGKATIAAHL